MGHAGTTATQIQASPHGRVPPNCEQAGPPARRGCGHSRARAASGPSPHAPVLPGQSLSLGLSVKDTLCPWREVPYCFQKPHGVTAPPAPTVPGICHLPEPRSSSDWRAEEHFQKAHSHQVIIQDSVSLKFHSNTAHMFTYYTCVSFPTSIWVPLALFQNGFSSL